MNIFKGLLHLHGYLNPADYRAELEAEIRREFGAGTADADFVPPLGNRSASRKWLGNDVRAARVPEAGCIAGGCG